jgi:hypothetical protein
MNRARRATVLTLATLLAGCAPALLSGRLSAASYRQLPAGATFAVIGSGSLTLTERHIQDLIRAQMESLGFQLSQQADAADFAVVYSYSIGAGNTVVSSSPDFVWGGQKVSSATSYPRYFQVSIVDIPASRTKNELVISWQAEIYSQGSSQNVSWLAEHFVPELFKRFGQTTNNDRVVKPVSVPLF